jgi:uncharacterized protein (DUF58 family)
MNTSSGETGSVKELLAKVRRIEIKARGLSRQLFSGQYHAAFKGRGMSFAEVREYQYGDDVRSIDWNVTARMRSPYLKVYEEERELSVMLLVDISASSGFGSVESRKRDIMAEIAAVISFSAIQNNDKIGLILFSDKIEHFIPPRKGKSHVLRLLRDLLYVKAEGKGTDIGEAIAYLGRVIKRRSTVFLLSDLGRGDFEKQLSGLGRKHDTMVVQVEDLLEERLPKAGLIWVEDPEDGRGRWLDTCSRKVRASLEESFKLRRQRIHQLLRSKAIDFVLVTSKTGYVQPLRQLFQQRGWRRSAS